MNDFSLINFLLKFSDIGDGEIKDTCISELGKPKDHSRRKGWMNRRFTLKIYGWMERSSAFEKWMNRRFTLKIKGGQNKVPHSKGGRVEDSHPKDGRTIYVRIPRDCTIVKTFI